MMISDVLNEALNGIIGYEQQQGEEIYDKYPAELYAIKTMIQGLLAVLDGVDSAKVAAIRNALRSRDTDEVARLLDNEPVIQSPTV